MQHSPIHLRSALVSIALILSAPSVLAFDAVAPAAEGSAAWIAFKSAMTPELANAHAQASPQAVAEYRRKLQEYEQVRAAFDAEAGAYWQEVSEKRRIRNAKRRDGVRIALQDYVLEHPPLYAGPPRPVNPEPQPPRPRTELPVMADFLDAARQHYQFVPDRISDAEFKRIYVRTARAAGLTLDQIVRVYSFETGGDGTHELQSGLNPKRPGSRAISTAMGYNQLLVANSIDLLAKNGDAIVRDLTARAARMPPPARAAMERKIGAIKRMVAAVRAVPYQWSEHEKLARTSRGQGVHALVLDRDVGPILQTHKLLTSVEFARRKGVGEPLTAAELEMMNLTGDGNGFDMVTMPQAMRERVPTANFFLRNGYERNPVAIRHNTVAKLLAVTDARMDSNSLKPGARELAAAQ